MGAEKQASVVGLQAAAEAVKTRTQRRRLYTRPVGGAPYEDHRKDSDNRGPWQYRETMSVDDEWP
jgi:hypothetical protein